MRVVPVRLPCNMRTHGQASRWRRTRVSRVRRTPLVGSATLAVLLSLTLLGTAGAAPAEAAPATDRWRTFSDAMADPWPELQREDGSFIDYVGHRKIRYGDAMMGYALLQSGIRDRDRSEIDAGLRGVGRAVRNKQWGGSISAFEAMAIAAAYRLARSRMPDDRGFRAEQSDWAHWLRTRAKTKTLERSGYFNHHLVEAVAVLEVLETGLHSSSRGSILANRAGSRRKAERIVNEVLPSIARKTTRKVRGYDTAMIADPPTMPLAYHGLATGFLARGIDLMGRRASSRARDTLRKALNASWMFAGPDGHLAYYGRSNEEAWALGFTSFAAERVAPRLRSSDAARMRNLSERALTRMRVRHGIGPKGLWIVPALREDLFAGRRALDSYANAPAFAGLAMVAVNWSLDDRKSYGDYGSSRRPPADVLLAGRDSELGVTRRASTWYAVKTAPRENADLRYDFGVLALKRRGGGGWHDAMPVRPTSRSDDPMDSAGPILLRDGRRGVPVGTSASLRRDGSLSVRMNFVSRSAGVLARGVAMQFKPTGCGVRLDVRGRRGDRFEYSGFFSRPPRHVAGTLRDPRLTLSASGPTTSRVEGNLHSATDPNVWRGRLTAAPNSGGVARFSLCGA